MLRIFGERGRKPCPRKRVKLLKILVFSDSHGRLGGMYDVIEREKPDAVIHLGDCVDDARTLRRSYPNLMVWFVRGNNDYEPDAPLSMVIAPAGVHMYLTHGHMERCSWSSVGVLPRRAREAGCAIALYGHTHRLQEESVDGLLILNPGSISLPRGGPASYLRMIVENGAIRELAKLNEDGAPYRGKKQDIGWM